MEKKEYTEPSSTVLAAYGPALLAGSPGDNEIPQGPDNSPDLNSLDSQELEVAP